MKSALKFTALAMAGLFVVGTCLIAYVGHQHQKAAIAFWGDDYNPEDNGQIDWGLLGNRFIPRGGPIIAREFFSLCDETPLPVVPVKLSPDGTGHVLCGLGTDSTVEPFSLDDIEDEQLRKAMRESLIGY